MYSSKYFSKTPSTLCFPLKSISTAVILCCLVLVLHLSPMFLTPKTRPRPRLRTDHLLCCSIVQQTLRVPFHMWSVAVPTLSGRALLRSYWTQSLRFPGLCLPLGGGLKQIHSASGPYASALSPSCIKRDHLPSTIRHHLWLCRSYI